MFAAICAVSLLTVSGVCAQENSQRQHPTAEQRAEFRTEQMTKELSLTEAQAAEVQAVNLAAEKEAETQMAAAKASRESRDAQMQKILTAEQYEKWQQMNKPGRREGMRPGKPGKPGEGGCPEDGPQKGGKDKQCNGKKCCKNQEEK